MNRPDFAMEAGTTVRSPRISSRSSRFQPLPEDLVELFGDRVFESEEELDTELKQHRLSDLPIILDDDGKAQFYIPGGIHNELTGSLAQKFTEWANKKKGCARVNTNVPLGPRPAGSPAPRKKMKRSKRLPDVAI